MSQYPFSQGQWPGHPSQHTLQQGTFVAPPPASAAEAYSASSYLATNQMAASQNAAIELPASSIPGLGFGASFLPQVATHQLRTNNHRIAGDYSTSLNHSENSKAVSDEATKQTLAEEIEEGEFSEANFEDLYDEDDSDDAAHTLNAVAPVNEAHVAAESNAASDTDFQDAAFYEDESGEIPSEPNEDPNLRTLAAAEIRPDRSAEPSDYGRERTGSYSPYLSPREVHHEDEIEKSGENGKNPERTADISAVESARNGHAQYLQSTTLLGEPPLPSMGDAKKEARKAILRLLPYGVKYQTYIDEGFDKDLIQSLFSELGLRTADASPPSPKKPDPPIDQVDAPAQPKAAVSEEEAAAAAKAEERRDRIARLLAAKATKPNAPSVPETKSTSNAAAPPSQTVAIAVHDKVKSKKELLLQQKMQALQKSRELRDAQSAARKKALEQSSTEVAAREQATHVPTAEKESSSAGQISTAFVSIAKPSIPSPAPPTATSRKRPVAADFVDYQVPLIPPKRPFGQPRQESFVIDVSEESDDGDVEMEIDMDSGGEDETSSASRVASSSNGNSIRDFPSLSDHHPQRAYGTSVSKSASSNSGDMNVTKVKDDQYVQKMKAIYDMKKRIADAEARKAQKTPVRVQTPTGSVGTPTSKPSPQPALRRVISATNVSERADHSSTRLASEPISTGKPASEATQSLVDRRKVASEQLRKLEGIRQEKAVKRKLLEEKLARLEQDLQGHMMEEQRWKDVLAEPQDEDDVPGLATDVAIATLENIEDARTQLAEIQSSIDDTTTSKPTRALSPKETAAVDVGSQDHLNACLPAAPAPRESPESGNLELNQNLTIPEQATSLETSLGSTGVVAAGIISPNGGQQTAKLGETGPDGDEDNSCSPDLNSKDASAVISPESSPSDGLTVDGEPSASMSSVSEPDGVSQTGEDGVSEPGEDDTAMPGLISEEAPGPAPISGTQEVQSIPETQTASTTQRERTRNSTSSHTSFKPYESPLQMFRSYRFHPQYLDLVRGGYTSMTYSSIIKPEVAFCPHEVGGQVCPEEDSCEFQHFSKIMPKDDRILMELGRFSDFEGAKRQEFTDGLRNLLHALRRRSMKTNLDDAASEIVAFRRRFLADPSKVLSGLEGVTI